MTLTFSQIERFDSDAFPLMRTTSQAGNDLWSCKSPNVFSNAMVQAYPHLQIFTHQPWAVITVTRNNQDLGTLHMIRQCLELWELEMEKWGCNGSGERLGEDFKVQSVCAYWFCCTARLTKISWATSLTVDRNIQ